MTDRIDPTDAADHAVLRRLARGKHCVDVGTFHGASAVAMLEAGAESVLCVDTFAGTKSDITADWTPAQTLSVLLPRLEPYRYKAQVLVAPSHIAAYLFPRQFNFVFLDAAHDYGSVMADIAAWRRKVVPGGILAGHDYDKTPERCDPDRLISRSHLDFCREDSCHYGVIRAVSEAFPHVNHEARVWWVEL